MDSKAISIFNYENKNITTIKIDDEIYFKAKDVALCLGYKNSKDAIITHVDLDDKITYDKLRDREIRPPLIENKIDKQTIFINESGLYSLILSSKLPTAKAFKRWITHNVIPSIRKTGKYEINQDENDYKKIQKIKLGYDFLNQINFINDRDKAFLGTQVKNLLINDKLLENAEHKTDEFEYPITRRLLDHGIKYNDKMKSNLIKSGKYLRTLYFEKYKKYPMKRNQYVDNAIREVNVYTNNDFDIMDRALSMYFKLN